MKNNPVSASWRIVFSDRRELRLYYISGSASLFTV